MTHEERVKALVGAVDYLQEVYAERERRYWTVYDTITGLARYYRRPRVELYARWNIIRYPRRP